MRISSSPRIVYWALACVWIVAGWHGASALPQGPDGTDRVTALQVFTAQTERYVRPRARFEEQLPSFDARRDPWSLMRTRGYLASAIRTARSYAHQGDVFTPPVAAMFRDGMAQTSHDVDIEGLVDEDLEAPDYLVDVVVNEPVPAWALQGRSGRPARLAARAV